MLAANSLRNTDCQLDWPNITESCNVLVLTGEWHSNSNANYVPFEDLYQIIGGPL